MTVRRKKLKWFTVAVLLMLLFGGYFANRFVKTKGYSHLWDFISSTGSNVKKGFSANYTTLELDISPADMEKLEAIRKRALDRGIMINEGDTYVPATVIHDGKEMKADIRLKGHMTDHLQEEKWSFRVKMKKGDAFQGMKRFSLQHPGTRAYVNEWVYHRMMKQEGIIALRYQFLKVKVNGNDWGIYALEEHFGQELIQNNKRPEGAIVRFNPDLYWQYRINELQKERIVEEFASYQSAFVDPYDTKNTLKDSSLRSTFVHAMGLMEAFRRGQKKTSEIFDTDKLARFHAIIDVVGGFHSLDWSDVKYYYNSSTQLLEPVAYESFSIRKADHISGTYRMGEKRDSIIRDHHQALFSDPVFYKAYIQELERIASKEWLDNFFRSAQSELENNLAIVAKEFPYKRFEKNKYYENVHLIQKIVNGPDPLLVHQDSKEKDSVVLAIGNVESLPVEIMAYSSGDFQQKLEHTWIIPSKQNGEPVTYHRFKVFFPDTLSKRIKVTYRIPGSRNVREKKVAEYPSYEESCLEEYYLHQTPLPPAFVLQKDKADWQIPAGKYVLEQDLVVPKNVQLTLHEGADLELKKGIRIIVKGSIRSMGSEEFPVIIHSGEEKGQGILLDRPTGNCLFQFTVFKDLKRIKEGDVKHKGVIHAYEANLQMRACVMEDCKEGLVVVRSNVRLIYTSVLNAGEDGIKSYFSNLWLTDVKVKNGKGDGVVLIGSFARMERLKVVDVQESGIVVKEYSGLRGNDIEIRGSITGIEAMDKADVDLRKVKISSSELAIKAGQKGKVFGPSRVLLYDLKLEKNKKDQEVEKGSVIGLDRK